jgi:hypothetical protein
MPSPNPTATLAATPAAKPTYTKVRKPTNRRAFIAWLTYTLEKQGVTVEQPLSYVQLQRAIEEHGVRGVAS